MLCNKLIENQQEILLIQSVDNGSLDVSDVISKCFEYQVQRVLIKREGLNADFYNLRTGIAGEVLQKLINYHIKASFVIDKSELNDRFQELMLEYNKGIQIHFCEDFEVAKQWIL